MHESLSILLFCGYCIHIEDSISIINHIVLFLLVIHNLFKSRQNEKLHLINLNNLRRYTMKNMTTPLLTTALISLLALGSTAMAEDSPRDEYLLEDVATSNADFSVTRVQYSMEVADANEIITSDELLADPEH